VKHLALAAGRLRTRELADKLVGGLHQVAECASVFGRFFGLTANLPPILVGELPLAEHVLGGTCLLGYPSEVAPDLYLVSLVFLGEVAREALVPALLRRGRFCWLHY
jgi:hypothetical protein